MSSPVGPLDITQFNNDLQNTSSASGTSELTIWYGDYQTFYPGATVEEFEADMLPFANAVQEAYGDFDPSNPTVYTQFLGALAASTAKINPTIENPVNYAFRDADTGTPAPTASELLATWVAFYKQYYTDDYSLSDIEDGLDLEFNESLGTFIQDTQENGGLYWPNNETYEVYQGQVVLSTFTQSQAEDWQEAYTAFYPTATEAEFQAILGLYASQKGSPVVPLDLQAFRNYVQNNALSPPFSTWQATYTTYFPGSSSASFQTFLNAFINGLPTQLTVANASQFFLQFQGYVIANSSAFQASGGAGAQSWQNVYKEYYPDDTSTDPLTDADFLTFLGQFSNQSNLGVLGPVSSLPQFRGALASSLLNSTQNSILQALYTQANPGASTATYLAYIGSLNPEPPTANMLAGLVLYNILSEDGLLASWRAAYEKYFGSSTSDLEDFLGEYLLSQPTAINPQNGLLQFMGGTVLSYFHPSVAAQWQAYYLQYYPSGSTAEFQSLVGELDSHSSGKLDPEIDFYAFKEVVLRGVLVPPLATWQAVYYDLTGSLDDFSADLEAFMQTQTVPLNLNTVYQSFVSYLLTHESSDTITELNTSWQKAYDQNFQQGSVPTPFGSDLARYLSFQYQVNAGGVTDQSVAAGQQAFIIGGFTEAEIEEWQNVFNQYNPGNILVYPGGYGGGGPGDFYNLVGIFAAYQPNGKITPSLLPQFTTLVESGRYRGFIINPAAIDLGKLATAGFSEQDFRVWQNFYNSYNPGANINQFYSFIAQQFAPNIPVGPLKQANGQIVPSTAAFEEFQAWVANNAFVTWTNSMSQVDYHSYQVVYQMLFPTFTAAQFQTFLLDYTGQFSVPTSPNNSNAFYDLFVGTALADGGIWGNTSATYVPFKDFYDDYFPDSEVDFETFLGGFANQLLVANQNAISNGTINAANLIANSLPQFEQKVVDAAFSRALNWSDSSLIEDFFVNPPSIPMPSAYANWYALFNEMFPSGIPNTASPQFQGAQFPSLFIAFMREAKDGHVIFESQTNSAVTTDSVLALPAFLGAFLAISNPGGFASAVGGNLSWQQVYSQLYPNFNPSTNSALQYYTALGNYVLDQKRQGRSISVNNTSSAIHPANLVNYAAWEESLAKVTNFSSWTALLPFAFANWYEAYKDVVPGANQTGFISELNTFLASQQTQGNPVDLNKGYSLFIGQMTIQHTLTDSTALSNWQTAYNQNYNQGSIPTTFEEALGRFVAFGGTVNPSSPLSFIAWTNSMSKVDFTSWRTVYDQYFPTGSTTPAGFESFLLNFTNSLSTPISSGGLQLFYQFEGAVAAASLAAAGQLTTWQNFFGIYYPASQFQAYLGQFSDQLLLNNLTGIQNGTKLPATLLIDSSTQFQQKVVDDAFTASLNSYTGVGSFTFPPSGTASIVASAYKSWYSAYQNIVSGASAADFQVALNNFITARVPQGVTINPTQTLPLFVGGVFDDEVGLSNWKTAYYQNNPNPTEDKYLEALGRFLLNHNIASSGSAITGASAIAAFSSIDRDTWWSYYKLYNLADTSASAQTDTRFLALLGQLAAQLNKTTFDASADLAAFQSLVSGISFTDWTNSMSKVDFTSWQSVYSQFFPTNTTEQFQAFLGDFLSGLPQPIDINDPLVNPANLLELYNQFVGALLLSNGTVGGSSATYAAFQAFYSQYYPAATTPQFNTYLGQFANQILLSYLPEIQKGLVDPATLLANALTEQQLKAYQDAVIAANPSQTAFLKANFPSVKNSFQQQIVDKAFTVALSSYTGAGDFVFPPIGAATLVPSAYTDWYRAYQQLNPGSGIVNFQDELNGFIEEKVLQGVAIDPIQALPLFVGFLAAFNPAFDLTQTAQIRAIFANYVSNIGAQGSNFTLSPGGFSTGPVGGYTDSEASIAAYMQVTSNQIQINLTNGSFTFTLDNGLLTSDATIIDYFTNTTYQPGERIDNPAFVSQVESLLTNSIVPEFTSWQTAYNQNVPYSQNYPNADQNKFLEALGRFLLNHNIASNGNPSLGLTATANFSTTDLNTWWNYYRQYNLADTSTSAKSDTQFLALVGQLASQLNATTLNASTHLAAFQNLVDGISFTGWTNSMSEVDFASWQSVYNQFFPTNTPEQFQDFLTNFLSGLPEPIDPNKDPLVNPSDSLELYNQFVGSLLLNNGTISNPSAIYSSLETFYLSYYPASSANQFEVALGKFANQLLLSNLTGISNGTVIPSTLLANSINMFQQRVVDEVFAATLANYITAANAYKAQNPTSSYATFPTFTFPPSGAIFPSAGAVYQVPSAYTDWYTAYAQVEYGTPDLVVSFQYDFNDFIKRKTFYAAPNALPLDPVKSLPLFVGQILNIRTELDISLEASIKDALYNFLLNGNYTVGVNQEEISDPFESLLNNPAFLPGATLAEKQALIETGMTVTEDKISIDTSNPYWAPYFTNLAGLSSTYSVPSFFFQMGNNGEVTCSLNLYDLGGDPTPTGTTIPDLTSILSDFSEITPIDDTFDASLKYRYWQQLYDQNRLGNNLTGAAADDAFFAALGAFSQNHLSSAPVGNGNPAINNDNTTAGNTAAGVITNVDNDLDTWWDFYKQYNSWDISTSALEDKQFIAFLGNFYSSLSSDDQTSFTTAPSSFYVQYQTQVLSIDYQKTGSITLAGFSSVQVSSWWNFFKANNLADQSTSAQNDPSFLAFLGQLAAQQYPVVVDGSDTSFSLFKNLINTASLIDWTNYVLGVPQGSELPEISISANAANRRRQAMILNELFKILNSMIGTIQQAVATVGNRLNFYADYQQKVTSEISDMPIYTTSGPEGNPLITNSTDANTQTEYAQYQSSANSIVQARQATLRALRDSVGSLTQQLQTTITQLNDAATNQGSIGTSILQTLSSILTLIFR